MKLGPWITVGMASSLLVACDQPIQPSAAAPATPAACVQTNGKAEAKPEVRQRIIGVVATQLGVDPQEVQRDAEFVDDLGADSLDLVEVVMALEEEFQIEIPDEDAEKLCTVAAIEAFMCKPR